MLKKILVAVLLLTLFVSGTAMAAGTLNVMIWPGYHSPKLVEKFEAKYSVKVNFIELDTYDKMTDYLSKNPGKVDLIIMGELGIPGLIQSGQLQPLNKTLIPNMKNADPMFLNLPYDPGNKYTLSYHYLFIGLAYNKDKVSEKEATLKNYFEPTGKFKGRVVTFPEARTNIGFAMKYMGKSFNSTNAADMALAKTLLGNLKKGATADSGNMSRGIYDGLHAINNGKADLTLYYYENPDTIQYLLGGLKVKIGFKIPEEGALIGTDAMCIAKSAKNVDAAHKFINFMYEPANAASSITYLGYAFPCKGAQSLINADLAKRIYIPTSLLKKCEFPTPLTPTQVKVYEKLWDEVF